MNASQLTKCAPRLWSGCSGGRVIHPVHLEKGYTKIPSIHELDAGADAIQVLWGMFPYLFILSNWQFCFWKETLIMWRRKRSIKNALNISGCLPVPWNVLGTHSSLHEDNSLKISKLPLGRCFLFSSFTSHVEACGAMAMLCMWLLCTAASPGDCVGWRGIEWGGSSFLNLQSPSGTVKQGEQHSSVCLREGGRETRRKCVFI